MSFFPRSPKAVKANRRAPPDAAAPAGPFPVAASATRKPGTARTQPFPTSIPPVGHSLPAPLRQRLESAFGADLADVKVHEDDAAPALGAIAYAQGNEVHVAAGGLEPASARGWQILAHEVAHVVQQQKGRVPTPFEKGARINRDPRLEREAELLGAKAIGGGPMARPGANPALAGDSAPIQLAKPTPEDRRRIREDLARRAQAQQKSRVSRGGWWWPRRDARAARNELRTELDQRVKANWWGRHTVDTRLDPAKPGDLNKYGFVDPPAVDPKAEGQDRDKAEEQYWRDLRNAETGQNPVYSTDQSAVETSGVWEASKASLATGARFLNNTPDYEAAPSPKSPSRISEERKAQLTKLLAATGRIDPKLAVAAPAPDPLFVKAQVQWAKNNPAKFADKYQARQSWLGRLGSRLRGAKVDPDVQRGERLARLGAKRQSGIDDKTVETHLGEYLTGHSKDRYDDPKNPKQVTWEAPLGHAHSAHGYQIPAIQQVERAVFGIRPDQRNDDPSTTPTGNMINANVANRLVGKDATEQADFNKLTQLHEFPQWANYKGGPQKVVATGNPTTSSQFTSPLSEFIALQQNLSEAWSHLNDIPNLDENYSFLSRATPNKAGKAIEYGRGFKVEKKDVANKKVPNLNRNQAPAAQHAAIQARGENVTATRQESARTVIKKREAIGNTGKITHFTVTTNYPDSNKNAPGYYKRVKVGKAVNDVLVKNPYEAPWKNVAPKNEDPNQPDDEQLLAARLANIKNKSLIGNIPYERDLTKLVAYNPLDPNDQKHYAKTGQLNALGKLTSLVRDKKTNNPLPDIDPITKKYVKQGF